MTDYCELCGEIVCQLLQNPGYRLPNGVDTVLSEAIRTGLNIGESPAQNSAGFLWKCCNFFVMRAVCLVEQVKIRVIDIGFDVGQCIDGEGERRRPGKARVAV